tara:strand:- start:54 stop:182 length:129 start_codon:yes stop_codon:yes gene_type:complete
MKTYLIAAGIFVFCYLMGNAIVEFVFMIREKLAEDQRNLDDH